MIMAILNVRYAIILVRNVQIKVAAHSVYQVITDILIIFNVFVILVFMMKAIKYVQFVVLFAKPVRLCPPIVLNAIYHNIEN